MGYFTKKLGKLATQDCLQFKDFAPEVVQGRQLKTDLTFSTCLVLSRVSSEVAGQIVKFKNIFFFK